MVLKPSASFACALCVALLLTTATPAEPRTLAVRPSNSEIELEVMIAGAARNDTVLFAPGHYLLPPCSIQSGATLLAAEAQEVVIRNIPATKKGLLSFIDRRPGTTTLNGLTFQGWTTANAIEVTAGEVALRNCLFQRSTRPAVHIRDGRCTVGGSMFRDIQTWPGTDRFGAAVVIGALRPQRVPNVWIDQCMFLGNVSGFGPAICLKTGNVTVTTSTFAGNRCEYDGGFEGILWILWTGAPRSALPTLYGSPTTCWRRLPEWEESGVLLELRSAFLARLNERRMIS